MIMFTHFWGRGSIKGKDMLLQLKYNSKQFNFLMCTLSVDPHCIQDVRNPQ